MSYISRVLVVVLLFNVVGTAQQETDRRQTNALSMLGFGEGLPTNVPSINSVEMMSSSVDEYDYIVDAGDVFIIKIDVQGPAFKLFNSVVTPDGYLVIPDAPTIFVKGMTLHTAKEKIDKILKSSSPQAQVESHLSQVHPITLSILGAIPLPTTIKMKSSNRLFDAIANLLNPSLTDTSLVFDWNEVSFRNIEVRRKDTAEKYDLLKFKLTGDRSNNPYLRDQDIIYIQYRDSSKYVVEVSGAVGKPVAFEYSKNDHLQLALQFASGLLPFADSSRIELARFNENDPNRLNTMYLAFPEDSNFVLQPDDRIYVREKHDYHKKSAVLIEGEVKYPGFYAIEAGRTTLRNLIEQAGGFTDRASLMRASVQRKKENIQDEVELKRLQTIRPAEMNAEEASYYRLRTRENRYLVSVDFNQLFTNQDSAKDILLFNEDLINVPEKKNTVFVSGGVRSPGDIKYQASWTYENYIEAAGGYTDLARESWTRIIDVKTGKWAEADEEIPVKEGDIIFVPEKEQLDFYRFFIETIAITSQIAAIVLVVITVAK
jgi:protein involved in polysaccharide export with SLBB domain